MSQPQSPARPGPATPTVHRTNDGCLKAVGDDALDLLNRLSTNKVDHLRPGHWAPTVLTTDRGRIVDLLSVVHAGEYILLITSPGRQQPVIDWLDKYTIMENMEVTDVSESTAVVAIAGTGAAALLGLEAAEPDYLPGRQYPAPTVSIGGCDAIAVCRPLGSIPGRLLLTPTDAAPALIAALADAGAVTADADGWDALRISAGAPAFGAEMGEPYNPLEAGLIGAIDFTKGCYIGQEVIARLDSYHKVQKRLAALSFAAGSDVTPGASLTHDGRIAGNITSLHRAPDGNLRGLGYIRTAAAIPGQTLQLQAPASGAAAIDYTPQLFGAGPDFS